MTTLVDSPSYVPQNKVIQKTRLTLLRGRTWRYLRYLHFRDALSRLNGQVESVCVCGAGHGHAEVALAAEFPHIKFVLTDIVNRKWGYPNYHSAMNMAWKWGIENLSFSIWNVLEPTHRRFDLVASTEMLEHIENFESAAANMRAAAKKFTYCLVPYADDATNADSQKRRRVWEKHEHFVCGYDQESLTKLFPSPVLIAGTYWAEAQAFRVLLTSMTDEEIINQQSSLQIQAAEDLRSAIPKSPHEALGIKILSAIQAQKEISPAN